MCYASPRLMIWLPCKCTGAKHFSYTLWMMDRKFWKKCMLHLNTPAGEHRGCQIDSYWQVGRHTHLEALLDQSWAQKCWGTRKSQVQFHHLVCFPVAHLCEGAWSTEMPLGRNWDISWLTFVLIYTYNYIYIEIYRYTVLRNPMEFCLCECSVLFYDVPKIWLASGGASWCIPTCACYKIRVCSCVYPCW